MGVCVPLCARCCFCLQRGYLLRWGSGGALRARSGYICMFVWAPHDDVSPSSVCLSLPLARCLSLLQSSPQNRPLIIVWCVSGSAVRSYKQRLRVFIAGRERRGWSSAGRLMEPDYRGEAPDRDLLSRPWSNRRSPSSSSSASHGSSVWSGSV